MKALSNFNLTIFLSAFVVLPICNSSNINHTATTYQVLHYFNYVNDGAYPQAGVIQASDGNFYGTTKSGSGKNNKGGTVFKITPQGKETLLYGFIWDSSNGLPAGTAPYAGLIQGKDGNFYGTTTMGGKDENGTIFKITPEGVKTTLYSFTSQTDGAFLVAGLIQGKDGNFYGTTGHGGTLNGGTVFKITPQGQETVLYNFAGGNHGAYPQTGLIQAKDGNFYGTTDSIMFKITPQGVETTLYRLTDGTYGGGSNRVIQGSDGNFYGTTSGIDYNGLGTVFKLSINQ